MNRILCLKAENVNLTEELTTNPVDVTRIANLVASDRHFIARNKAEIDVSYRQVIPYVTLMHEEHIFVYSRKGGEERLHGKESIGVGGHIDYDDTLATLYGPVVSAAWRELNEELQINSRELMAFDLSGALRGLICLNETTVDRVHLGFWYLVKVKDISNIKTKSETKGGVWRHRSDFDVSKLENWSKLVFPKCYSK